MPQNDATKPRGPVGRAAARRAASLFNDAMASISAAGLLRRDMPPSPFHACRRRSWLNCFERSLKACLMILLRSQRSAAPRSLARQTGRTDDTSPLRRHTRGASPRCHLGGNGRFRRMQTLLSSLRLQQRLRLEDGPYVPLTPKWPRARRGGEIFPLAVRQRAAESCDAGSSVAQQHADG